MLNGAKKNDTLLAVKRCIESMWNQFDWDDFGYYTNSRDFINNHPRLLRSLGWGDDDYPGHIFDVLEHVTDEGKITLQQLAEYVKLYSWLKENDKELFYKLYGVSELMLDHAQFIAITNSFELHQHIERINKAILGDPELAIGSTKEMLETVLKTIIEGFGETVEKTDDLPKLSKKARGLLKLQPSDIDSNAKGEDIIKQILSNISSIIDNLNQLRNLYGTGHGKTRRSGVTARHARYVVGLGATTAIFLMETYEARKAEGMK